MEKTNEYRLIISTFADRIINDLRNDLFDYEPFCEEYNAAYNDLSDLDYLTNELFEWVREEWEIRSEAVQLTNYKGLWYECRDFLIDEKLDYINSILQKYPNPNKQQTREL